MPLIPNNFAVKPEDYHEEPATLGMDACTESFSINSKARRMLHDKGFLRVAVDGKMYLTQKGAQYFVSKSVVKSGSPEYLLEPGVNLFGFACIDGRVELPEGFENLSDAEKAKVFIGAIPGGGAGMLMSMIATLHVILGNSTGGNSMEIIREIVFKILEANKKISPENYKIQWHTDTHSEHDKHNHDHDGKFQCGCGFIMKTIENPEYFGMTRESMDFVLEILNNPEWTAKPDVLGQTKSGEVNKNLEQHKETITVIAGQQKGKTQKQRENFVLRKQVDFSVFFSEEELASLSPEERDEFKLQGFTYNPRQFAVASCQLADALEKMLRDDRELLEKITLSEEQTLANDEIGVYAPMKVRNELEALGKGNAIRMAINRCNKAQTDSATNKIKSKLSPGSWVTVIQLDEETGQARIVQHMPTEKLVTSTPQTA